MRVPKEVKNSIKGCNNTELKKVLESELEDRIKTLKVVNSDGLKDLQGYIRALEEILNLL